MEKYFWVEISRLWIRSIAEVKLATRKGNADREMDALKRLHCLMSRDGE